MRSVKKEPLGITNRKMYKKENMMMDIAKTNNMKIIFSQLINRDLKNLPKYKNINNQTKDKIRNLLKLHLNMKKKDQFTKNRQINVMSMMKEDLKQAKEGANMMIIPEIIKTREEILSIPRKNLFLARNTKKTILFINKNLNQIKTIIISHLEIITKTIITVFRIQTTLTIMMTESTITVKISKIPIKK